MTASPSAGGHKQQKWQRTLLMEILCTLSLSCGQCYREGRRGAFSGRLGLPVTALSAVLIPKMPSPRRSVTTFPLVNTVAERRTASFPWPPAARADKIAEEGLLPYSASVLLRRKAAWGSPLLDRSCLLSTPSHPQAPSTPRHGPLSHVQQH